eukprot:7911190-Alexandrium_andersonii.AAC.1
MNEQIEKRQTQANKKVPKPPMHSWAAEQHARGPGRQGGQAAPHLWLGNGDEESAQAMRRTVAP